MYGGDGARLPYISQHAAEFTNARSAGCWTLPATASIFTGLTPHEHGADTQSRGLDPAVPTLAQRLRDRGYSTHQVTANVATTDIFGLDRGFDEVVRIWKEVPSQHQRVMDILLLLGKPRLRHHLMSMDWIQGRLSEDLEASKVWLQDTVTDIFDRARRILADNQRKGKSSFLFLNLMESHFPYHVDSTFKTTGKTPLEDLAEVAGLYHVVNQTFLTRGRDPVGETTMRRLRMRQRRAWERLAPDVDSFTRELHEGNDNLVVVASDHGDCFGEHGWSYHFSNVTDGGNRVPLFWLTPGSNTKKIVTPVSTRDIYHGILAEVGAPTWHPVQTPERSIPVMQSAWYNSQGNTLPKYKYNQICLLENGMRWMRRDGRWYMAPPSTLSGEPAFAPAPKGVDPIEESPLDADRRTHYRRLLSDFEAYSTRIAP